MTLNKPTARAALLCIVTHAIASANETVRPSAPNAHATVFGGGTAYPGNPGGGGGAKKVVE